MIPVISITTSSRATQTVTPVGSFLNVQSTSESNSRTHIYVQLLPVKTYAIHLSNRTEHFCHSDRILHCRGTIQDSSRLHCSTHRTRPWVQETTHCIVSVYQKSHHGSLSRSPVIAVSQTVFDKSQRSNNRLHSIVRNRCAEKVRCANRRSGIVSSSRSAISTSARASSGATLARTEDRSSDSRLQDLVDTWIGPVVSTDATGGSDRGTNYSASNAALLRALFGMTRLHLEGLHLLAPTLHTRRSISFVR